MYTILISRTEVGGGGAKLRFSPAKIFGGRRRKTPLRFGLHHYRSFFFAFATKSSGSTIRGAEQPEFSGETSSLNMAGKGIGCLSEALGALRISAPKVWASALSFLPWAIG